MRDMANRDAQSRLLPTPFVTSFIGRAHAGDLSAADPALRESAWAWWAVSALEEFRGISDREYAALRLPGKFHTPGDSPTPKVAPHLEVPQRVLERPDPEFPARLAQAGNGLLFPWWLVGEVTAVKRAVFNTPRPPIAALLTAVNAHRENLAQSVADASAALSPQWDTVETLLVASPEKLVSCATGNADVSELSSIFNPAKDLELSLVFDSQLRESNGRWAARRLGAWQLRGVSDTGAFALGVVTPRLTANSLFNDALFAPEAESPSANLVRLVLLQRIAREIVGAPVSGRVAADPTPSSGSKAHLRAVVARVGAKLPEASMEAAANFVQTFDSAERAWASLETWAESGYILTVSRESFVSAFESVRKYVRRSDTPPRDLIDAILPLAWDSKGRVVRVTFSRSSDHS